MFYNNPFSGLTELVSPLAIQGFVVLMIALVALGTIMDIIHKKNVKYFFNNAKKAKKNAKVELTTGQRTSVILKTVAHEIAKKSCSRIRYVRHDSFLGYFCVTDIFISNFWFFYAFKLNNYVACWSYNYLFRWVLVLVFS